MHIEVVSSVNEACSASFHNKTAIVVDVLRATSTIVTALAAGATCVIPAETVMDAKQLQRAGDIIGGERFCRKITGFDYGNSPGEYGEEQVNGRRLILTTTNGTRAIHKSRRAERILTASLLNASACAQYAVGIKRDVVILCAGTNDTFALEDGLCAGLLIDCMTKLSNGSLTMDDFGMAMLSLYRDRSNQLEESLLACASGKRLAKLGLLGDIYACAHTHVYDLVPQFIDNQLIVH